MCDCVLLLSRVLRSMNVRLVYASTDVIQQVSTPRVAALLQVTGPFAGEPVEFSVSNGE